MPMIVTDTWSIPTPDAAIVGRATHYKAGLMETVAFRRHMSLRGYLGGVALNRKADLGRDVWIQWDDGTIEGPYLVVDCARQNHYPDRERRGYVLEVDAGVAMRRGFYHGVPPSVTVHFQEPGGYGQVSNLPPRPNRLPE
jgi:hypothetical protein